MFLWGHNCEGLFFYQMWEIFAWGSLNHNSGTILWFMLSKWSLFLNNIFLYYRFDYTISSLFHLSMLFNISQKKKQKKKLDVKSLANLLQKFLLCRHPFGFKSRVCFGLQSNPLQSWLLTQNLRKDLTSTSELLSTESTCLPNKWTTGCTIRPWGFTLIISQSVNC